MSRLLTVIVLLSMSFFSLSALSQTIYVSDQLNVPLRSGASTQHRIVKFISSGANLNVLDTSKDGKYYRVQTLKGKKGWIEKKDIMNQESARVRIVAMKEKFSNINQTIEDYEAKITQLKQANSLLGKQYKSLESDKQSMQSEYEDLKITASNPVAISRKNKQLQRELDQVLASETMLEKENRNLQDNIMQDWFLIGGGVSIGSLVLGLLLTRVNWRRKRDSWGDSF